MTKKESQVKTKEKVSAIEILLRQLEVSIEAKQVVTDKGVIENMVFYRDNEKYTIEEPEETAPITDKKMIRLPIYGTKTLRLAFEFGLILSEVAKEQNVVLTKDIVARAQSVFINEINTKGFKKTALGFVPLILAVFETK